MVINRMKRRSRAFTAACIEARAVYSILLTNAFSEIRE